MFWKEGGQRDVLQRGYTVVREEQFRVARLGAWLSTRVKLGANPAVAILAELSSGPLEHDRDGPASDGLPTETLRSAAVCSTILAPKQATQPTRLVFASY